MIKIEDFVVEEESRDYYALNLPRPMTSNYLGMYLNLTPKSDCIVVKQDFDKIVDEKVSPNQVSKDSDRKFEVEIDANSGSVNLNLAII